MDMLFCVSNVRAVQSDSVLQIGSRTRKDYQATNQEPTSTITIVPVRIHTNLKAETIDEFEQKKKGLHISAFKFRVEELRSSLLKMAKSSKRWETEKDKDDGMLANFIDRIIAKVRDSFQLIIAFITTDR